MNIRVRLTGKDITMNTLDFAQDIEHVGRGLQQVVDSTCTAWHDMQGRDFRIRFAEPVLQSIRDPEIPVQSAVDMTNRLLGEIEGI